MIGMIGSGCNPKSNQCICLLHFIIIIIPIAFDCQLKSVKCICVLRFVVVIVPIASPSARIFLINQGPAKQSLTVCKGTFII